MLRIRRFLGQSKQDVGKNDTPVQEAQVQEGVDAVTLSTDIASAQEVLVVSPSHAIGIMSDAPNQSAEEIASMVNDLAHRDVSKSSTEPSVSGKRKSQQADEVEGPPKKRVAKEKEATRNGDDPPATSTNGITGHEGSSNRASSEAVQVTHKKLGRPLKRHVLQISPALEKSDKMWDPAPSPEKQAENVAPTPTSTKRTPPSTETTPRGRGRPRKTTPTKEDQSRKPHNLQIKPRRKQLSKGAVSSDLKTRQGNSQPTESSPHRIGPNARSKDPRANKKDDHEERAQNSRSTRSTTAASRSKDVPSITDTEKLALRAANGEKVARASANKVSAQVREEKVTDCEGSANVQNLTDSIEHNGERREGDDLEKGGSRDPSTQMSEGEAEGSVLSEDDSDIEDSIQVNEAEEEEDGEEEPELFGQEKAWKTVLEGARSICGPKLSLNKMPKLFTERIRDLVWRVGQARDLYEQLLPFGRLGHDSLNGINDELRETLDAIEDRIKTLSEETAASEAGKMIWDIFARAIPAMVFLLRSALVSRVYHSDEPCDLKSLNEIVSGLREIIRLQKMAILLCEKAKYWKAKPTSSRPIKAPTTQKIFPRLRDMKDTFSKVLLEQDRKRKSKQNAVDYKLRQQERVDFLRQANQEAARKDAIWHRRIRESREQEDQSRQNEKRTLQQIREDEMRARVGIAKVDGHVESRTTWSDAEDLELYFELEKGYVGNMTCKLPEKSPATSSLFANHHCSYRTIFEHTEHAPVAE